MLPLLSPEPSFPRPFDRIDNVGSTRQKAKRAKTMRTSDKKESSKFELLVLPNFLLRGPASSARDVTFESFERLPSETLSAEFFTGHISLVTVCSGCESLHVLILARHTIPKIENGQNLVGARRSNPSPQIVCGLWSKCFHKQRELLVWVLQWPKEPSWT